MKQFLFLTSFILLCAFSFSQNAGKEYVFSAGAETGVTVASYSSRHPFMYGGSFQAGYYFYETAAFTLKAAYQVFPTKTSIYYDSTNGQTYKYAFSAQSFVPILLGLKMHLTEKYYLHPQVGVCFRNFGTMGAGYALGGGVQYKHIDISLRFEGMKKQSFTAAIFALRAAYQF